MSESGEVTCLNCGTVSPASAPICQACGRALPGLADRLFADDTTPRGPDAGTAPPAAAPASGRGSLFTPSTESYAPPPTPPSPPPPASPPPSMAPPPPLPSFDGPVWDEPAPADPTAPEPPKRRTALLLGAIIAVIVVATAAFLLFGGDDEPTPSASTTSTPTTDTAAATTTSAVATDPPADPTNLAVAPTGPTTMELTWIDAADNEDRYLVGRVRSEAVDEIADLPANTTSYVVDALEPDTLYCFTVAATNGATGEPHFLPQVCAVTGT